MRRFRFICPEQEIGEYFSAISGFKRGEVYSESEIIKAHHNWVSPEVSLVEEDWEEVFEEPIVSTIRGFTLSEIKPIKPLHKDTDLGYFSGLAMQGLMTKDYVKLHIDENGCQYTNLKMVAEMSIELAKELIKQLNEEQ